LIQENYLLFSNLFSSQSDFKKSLEYYKLYSDIKDSIFTVESNDRIDEIKANLEKKQNEISKKYNIIREKSLFHKILELRLLLIISLSCLVVILLYYVYWTQNIDNKDLKLQITKREKAEETLISSEERLKILFESAPDAYYLSDLKGTFIDGNKAAEDLIGYKKEELIGKSFLKIKLLSAKELLRASKLLLKNVQGKGTGPDEFILNRKDGSQVSVEIRTYPVQIKDKTVILGIARDVSERQKAEETLRESEEKYRTLVETIVEGIGNVDINETFTYVNKAAADIFGYTKDEMIGKNMKEFTSPEMFQQILEYTTVRKKGDSSFYEIPILRKNGEQRIITVTSTPIFDKNGKYQGAFGIFHDITESKKLEDELKDSEIRYHNLFENSSEFLFTLDLKGNFTDVNKAAEVLTGFTKSELLEMNFKDYTPKRDHKKLFRTFFNIYKTGKPIQNFSFEAIIKDKSIKYFDTSFVLLKKGEQIIGYQGSSKDITERKRAEVELLKAHEELKEFHKDLQNKVDKTVEELREKDHVIIQQSRFASMGEMIGNIAHHWRQPLQAVGGIIQTYEDAYEEGRLDLEYLEKHSNIVMDILIKMSRTIDDFRFFFKPDKAKENFNVKEIILKTLKFLDSSFKFNQINVFLDLAEDCVVEGFPNEYSQVVLVILKNAKDELIERNIKDRKITIILKKMNDKYVVTISDNAGGITKEILPLVFDPYFTTKEQGKGTGVGLYMAKMIIEKNMDGKLSARNLKDGAEFRIEV
ncbi:MAG: PAS domain S-box protein, partial [Armatimonadetes bacterium]|nr:PAS domain S-box protein [Armatimonadota bacterium]